MNDDTGTGQRHALSPTQEKWAKAVADLLGIGLEKQTAAGGVYTTESLHRRYRERREKASAHEREAIEAEIARKETELGALAARLAEEELSGEAREALEEEHDELLTALGEDRATLGLVEKAERHLDAILAVEKDLDAALEELGEEIGALEDRLAGEGDLEAARAEAIRGLAEEDAARFRIEHDNVARLIEQAIRQSFPMVKLVPVPGGEPIEKSRTYTAIDRTEYAILHGMLQKAELTLLTDGIGPALAAVARAKRQLDTYRAARMGARLMPEIDTASTPVDSQLADVEACEARLLGKGYARAAGGFESRREALDGRVRAAMPASPEEIVEQFGAASVNLLEEARAAVATMEEIEAELATVRDFVKVFRANGDARYAEFAERRLGEFDRDRPLADCLADARALHERYEARRNRRVERHADLRGLDREALEERLGELRETYDSLFRHDGDEVKTIRDSKTRELKGAKRHRYRQLPREAIREFELMLQASEQLVATGSVDALAKAGAWLEDTGRAMDTVVDDPKVYVRIDEVISRHEKRLAKYAGKYPLYMVGRRAELHERVAGMRARENTAFAQELLAEARAFSAELDGFKEQVIALRGRKRALAKKADAVADILGTIGGLLEKEYSKRDVRFSGYHGEMADQLGQARDDIEKRQATTLDRAEATLLDIETRAERVLDLMRRDVATTPGSRRRWRRRKTDAEALREGELGELTAFLREAEDGQRRLEEREARHDAYTDLKKDLQSRIEAVRKTRKKHRLDPTDADLLEDRRGAIRAEIKASKDFPKGLADMQALETHVKALENATRDARAALDKSMTETARELATTLDALHAELDAFIDKVQAKGGADYDALGPEQQDRLAAYVAMLQRGLPRARAGEIARRAETVADREAEVAERKKARKAALAALRALAAHANAFPPLDHYGRNPFEASAALRSLRDVLGRLEIKLLTAIEA
jgi:hypothetical protein